MSKDEGKKPVKAKRFFIQGSADLHKRLQHLAIDLNSSAERLGGELLAEAVARAEAEAKAGKRKPASAGQ